MKKTEKIIVSELFTSIQGEGPEVGEPAFFIRLSGCNLKCRYCDTKYSWNKGRAYTIDYLFETVLNNRLKNVIITGGEPTLQKNSLIKLIEKLKKQNFKITIETNGTIADKTTITLLNLCDTVNISPKLPSFIYSNYPLNNVIKILKELTNYVCIKLVVNSNDDWSEIEGYIKELLCGNVNVICFQPNSMMVNSLNEYIEITKELWNGFVEFAKTYKYNTPIRFIPQIHQTIFWRHKGI